MAMLSIKENRSLRVREGASAESRWSSVQNTRLEMRTEREPSSKTWVGSGSRSGERMRVGSSVPDFAA